MEREIVAVRRQDGRKDGRIIGFLLADNTYLSKQEVVSEVEAGAKFYVKTGNGPTAGVSLSGHGSKEYVKTTADHDLANNFDHLPTR